MCAHLHNATVTVLANAQSHRMDSNNNFLDATNASIGHISDNIRPSKRKQHGVANKHLGIFIEKYYQSHSHLGLKQDSCPDNLPFHVIDNDEFVGQFLNFLAKEATWIEDSNKLLSLKSAVCYASAFKMFYLNHFRSERRTPKPLQEQSWTVKTRLITQIKGDHHRKENTPLSQSKVTMTTDDRIAFATVCILEGNSKFAEMFLLANCAAMLAGRGSDVAASSLDDISVCIRDDEINPTYSILYQATTRIRLQPKQPSIASSLTGTEWSSAFTLHWPMLC
jgi:hypothetical protein